jgi:hypothetical protein
MIVSAELIRGIDIEFVTIGDPGNAPDARIMDDGTSGYGSVAYDYRIGKYEITNTQWNSFGGGSYFTGDYQPANRVSWYEATQFCNYLTSGDRSKGVYLFSGSQGNLGDFLGIIRELAEAVYGTTFFLPTENEWYKAAYYKGDGFSLYANGTNSRPSTGDACYGQREPYYGPWNVGLGMEEQNGTYDMMGNIWEWTESKYMGSPIIQGGCFTASGEYDTLASSFRGIIGAFEEKFSVGFRVATNTIPEPFTLLMLGLGTLALRKRPK